MCKKILLILNWYLEISVNAMSKFNTTFYDLVDTDGGNGTITATTWKYILYIRKFPRFIPYPKYIKIGLTPWVILLFQKD